MKKKTLLGCDTGDEEEDSLSKPIAHLETVTTLVIIDCLQLVEKP